MSLTTPLTEKEPFTVVAMFAPTFGSSQNPIEKDNLERKAINAFNSPQHLPRPPAHSVERKLDALNRSGLNRHSGPNHERFDNASEITDRSTFARCGHPQHRQSPQTDTSDRLAISLVELFLTKITLFFLESLKQPVLLLGKQSVVVSIEQWEQRVVPFPASVPSLACTEVAAIELSSLFQKLNKLM